MMKRIVIIPAYNEEKNIRNVIRNIERSVKDIDILVINDCSSDKTSEVVMHENVHIIDHALQSGYGASLQTGYKYAKHKNYDVVIQLDGDGQHDPGYIATLAATIESGYADLAIGSRFLGNLRKYNMQPIRKIGLIFFQFIIYLLTKKKISDPTSGYQALSKKVIKFYAESSFFPSDFPDADMLVHLIHSGARIEEVPVVMYENRDGKSIHSGFKPIYYIIKMILSLYIVQNNKFKK